MKIKELLFDFLIMENLEEKVWLKLEVLNILLKYNFVMLFIFFVVVELDLFLKDENFYV